MIPDPIPPASAATVAPRHNPLEGYELATLIYLFGAVVREIDRRGALDTAVAQLRDEDFDRFVALFNAASAADEG